MKDFSPIAIVGVGTIVPGCLSHKDLWNSSLNGIVHLSELSYARNKSFNYLLHDKLDEYISDKTCTLMGGYINNFEKIFNTQKFNLDQKLINELDNIFKWSMQAAYEALHTNNISYGQEVLKKTGVIFGNLSLPTQSLVDYAIPIYLEQLFSQKFNNNINPLNRFMSGSPALVLAKSLNLGGVAYTIDAACASGIYAIKLACDELHSRNADLMLAGGVNAVESPFINVAFSSLNALSKSGQSRPFCQNADGLLPGEGAAFVALKRLKDVKDDEKIYGVIRGIGISSSGKTGGFLAPSVNAEVECMMKAYNSSTIQPHDIQYIECHATGTISGDSTELLAIKQVFGNSPIILSSLKANIGHLLTASGVASLIKVIGCFNSKVFPKSINAKPLNQAFENTNFKVLDENQVWDGTMIAAVNAFGFGGNNGHLIVQSGDDITNTNSKNYIKSHKYKNYDQSASKIAVVSLGVKSSFAKDVSELTELLFNKIDKEKLANHIHETSIILDGSTPPKDLSKTIGQQLLLLSAFEDASQHVELSQNKEIGVYVGMSTDAEICRYCMRIKLESILEQFNINISDAEIKTLKDIIAPPLDASISIGMMPQLIANRISAVLNSKGPSFAVSAEELSGDMALKIGITGLINKEIDIAIVGAVDLSNEIIHNTALNNIESLALQHGSDAAGVIILKRFADAIHDSDQILAIIDASNQQDNLFIPKSLTFNQLGHMIGYPSAASGLLNMMSAIIMCCSGIYSNFSGNILEMLEDQDLLYVINRDLFGNTVSHFILQANSNNFSPSIINNHYIYSYEADNYQQLILNLTQNNISSSNSGRFKVAFISTKDQAEKKRSEALALLEKKGFSGYWFINNIAFSSLELINKVAFVFSGTNSAYSGFMKDIAVSFPALIERCKNSELFLRSLPSGIINKHEEPLSTLEQFIATSTLSQIHALFNLELLNLNPDAAIGVSLGEIDALLAFGVWKNADRLAKDVENSQIYGDLLLGELTLVKNAWGFENNVQIKWKNYFVKGDIDKLHQLLLNIERVFCLITYTDNECIIGGDEQYCKNLLDDLRDHITFLEINYNFAVHCPIVNLYKAPLNTLYNRQLETIPSVNFYSNFFKNTYNLSQQNICDAIVGQLTQTVNFPETVRAAWDDGIRLFLCHGPKSLLSTAISSILQNNEHIAIPLNIENKNSFEQMLFAAASLWVLGVKININQLCQTIFTSESKKLIWLKLRLPLIVQYEGLSKKQSNFDVNYHNMLLQIHEDINYIHKSYLEQHDKANKVYTNVINKIVDNL